MACRRVSCVSLETAHQKHSQNGLPSMSASVCADAFERGAVDLEQRALGVKHRDELVHLVEGDAGELLAILVAQIGGENLGATDDDGAVRIWHRAHC